MSERSLFDQYDKAKFKLHANVRWLFSFIPRHHVDEVKSNVVKNLATLQPPPHETDSVWSDIIALLVSCEMYRCACLAIFGPPAPTNHWDVIQVLAKHGFYAIQEDGAGVVQNSLVTASPFKQEAHTAVIDSLMNAYSCHLVTIPRVVAAVKRIGPFNASQELPYDVEDSLILWLNKICEKVLSKMMKDQRNAAEEQRLGLVHPVPTETVPDVQRVEDLVQDIGDGQALGVLIHNYLPKDLPIDALKFGPNLMPSERASNMAAVRFTLMTALGMDWFPMKLEMFLHPCFTIKANLLVFMSELFWKFELKGSSRTDFSTKRLLKEEEAGPQVMLCAAAATEISTQLSKTPIIIDEHIVSYNKSESSGEEEEDEVRINQFSRDEAMSQLENLLYAHTNNIMPLPTKAEPTTEEISAHLFNKLEEEEQQLDTFRYFQNTVTSPNHSTHTLSDHSQSLGQISIPELPHGDVEDIMKTPSTAGPTSQSLRQLHIATEGLDISTGMFRSSLAKDDVKRFVEQPPPEQPPPDDGSFSKDVRKKLSLSIDTDPLKKGIEKIVTKNEDMNGIMDGVEITTELNVTYTKEEEENEKNEEKKVKEEKEKEAEKTPKITQIKASEICSFKVTKSRKKSGEEKVEEMEGNETEKREFYTNIAKWVATVEKECKVEPLPDSQLLNNPALTKSLKNQFSRESPLLQSPFHGADPLMPHPLELPISGLNHATLPMVGQSYTISSINKEEAKRKGIPIINNSISSLDIPIAPAAAPPDKIKEDYSITIYERDEAIRKKKELEEKKKKEELDRKRILEEELAEKKALEEMSDSSNKSDRSKKGKKAPATKGKPAGNAKNAKQKEGKSFPRRPSSGGSNSSDKSNKSNKSSNKPAKGKNKSKDDMSIKSEKSLKSKSAKLELGGAKRRVKSAGRAGKSVSFIDECAPSTATLPPVIDLIPKEEDFFQPVCPHKKDTKVIGDDSAAVEKSKIAFFVPLDISGVGVGSGPVNRLAAAYPNWEDRSCEDRSCEDSLQVMPEITSLSSGSEISSEIVSSEDEKEKKKEVQLRNGDVQQILDTLRPQINDSKAAFTFENRGGFQPSVPLPSDPKQLLIHLQIQEKRKNIERQRDTLIQKWQDERAAMNRHVFYEALKKTKDVGEQAIPENIRSEIERSDSLENVKTITDQNNSNEPFSPNQSGAAPTHIRPPTLMEQAIAVTEEIFSTPNLEEGGEDEAERPRDEETDKLVGVFSNHEQFLKEKTSSPTTPSSAAPSTMQYFYGFTDVITDNSVSEKRKKFVVAQMKKQEEMKARRELELQRKLENARQKTHMDAVLRRDDGNLITKYRAKSARVRVITPNDDDLITKPSPPRAKSAVVRKEIITCKTAEPGPMYPNKDHMYPQRPPVQNGGMTYRKHCSQPLDRSPKPNNTTPPKPNNSTPPKGPRTECQVHRKRSEPEKPKPKLVRKDSTSKPPSLPLFVKPSVKSNSKVVGNAICWTCLSGVPDRQLQQNAILAISEHPSTQYVILFRDRIACKFRAIYTFDSETEKLSKIFGVGPRTITKDKISKLYKYDSGSRGFTELPTSNFSPTVDGICIENSVWKKAGVAPS